MSVDKKKQQARLQENQNKRQLKATKKANQEEHERKRRKALYGTRSSSKIHNSKLMLSKFNTLANSSHKNHTEDKGKNASITWKEWIIIESESRRKAVFDVLILIFVGYSCVTSMFVVAFNFDEPVTTGYNSAWDYVDDIIEKMFIVDLLLHFIQAVKHPETYEDVTDLKVIAKEYIKGWFFIDFISVFPFYLMFPQAGKTTKLFRLFRLPRLLQLFSIQKASGMLKSLMKSGPQGDQRIVTQYILLYIYKIIRLNIIAIFITYLIGCTWYFICYLIEKDQQEQLELQLAEKDRVPGAAPPEKVPTFIEYNAMNARDIVGKLTVSCYFALTTLSTVGYGDFYPVSNLERIICVCIMLGGVAFFSYIMGNFIEIISNYQKKMGSVDKSQDLHNWITLLTRFTNNKTLSSSLISEIEASFAFYWAQDRLQCLSTEEPFLEQLPNRLKNQIMTVYLFSDVFEKFKRFFNVDTVKESRFLYEVSFGFMPRKYEPTEDDKVVYDEEEEVAEMYFFTEGAIGIGFTLVANGISAQQHQICKKWSAPSIIGDHYVVNQCKSQFVYMVIQKEARGFALTKKFLHEQVFPNFPDMLAKISKDSERNYLKLVYKPINTERQSRIALLNKQSVYRHIELKEKPANAAPNLEQLGEQETERMARSKALSERIVAQNLSANIESLENQIEEIHEQMKGVLGKCGDKMKLLISQIERIEPR